MKIMKVDPTGGSYHATAAKVAKSGIKSGVPDETKVARTVGLLEFLETPLPI